MRHYMNEDIQLLYKETLEREDKITMAHSIEMREPFLDLRLIRLSMKIDLRLNVKGVSDVFASTHTESFSLKNWAFQGISHIVAK